MAFNLTQTLINSRPIAGNPKPGNEIALRIDQALLQDVLGTLVMLELEAMGVERVKIGLAAQYIDHKPLSPSVVTLTPSVGLSGSVTAARRSALAAVTVKSMPAVGYGTVPSRFIPVGRPEAGMRRVAPRAAS
jgi:homoaconitase/3-isopropylmalate dehydratase large subunit